jgi:hypothetical protein
MAGLELRPLSLGEILDRTFSLYRRHFLLFLGISGIPQLLVLGFRLAQGSGGLSTALNLVLLGLLLIVASLAYLLAQGGTILAVSELYLGRPTSIAESLRRVWGEIGPLFGVLALNGLAIVGALLLFVIPGVYVACRLLVCVPAALIEQRGPRESLSRSFDLTRDNAGRAFVILVFCVILTYGAQLLFALPFGVALVSAIKDPSMARFWLAMTQVSSSVATALVQPVLLIATSIFYFDLRVRKEGFDLQLMMNPDASQVPGTSSLPSIIS